MSYLTRLSKSREICTGTLIDHLFYKYIDGKKLPSGIFISIVQDHFTYFTFLIWRKVNSENESY